jgi:hypothetical protein
VAQSYREARDGDMIKHFLGEPDDIALIALGPIVVTRYRLQELDAAKGINLATTKSGRLHPKKFECLRGVASENSVHMARGQQRISA